MQSVGVIRQLTRYPVKSMQGEALPSAALTLQGFAEDRRYAFVQAASRSSFPWLTARELPELLYYRTSVEKAGTPEVAVTVATPMERIGPLRAMTSAKRSRRDREGRSFCCVTTAGRTMSRLSLSSADKRLRASRKRAERRKIRGAFVPMCWLICRTPALSTSCSGSAKLFELGASANRRH